MTKKEGRGLVGVKNVEFLFPGVFGPPEILGSMNE
jgi:5'-methylthioadenosine phosphorylase